MNNKNNDIIMYEDKSVYDGWCLKYNQKSGKIRWRKAWFVDRLSLKRKKEIEQFVKQNLINQKTKKQMNKNYLDLDFKSGYFFQYAKEPTEGYELHEGKTGTTSYRKYYKSGVSGVLDSASLHENKFGEQISLRILNDGDVYYTSVRLYDQRSNIDSFAQSLISYLPNLKKGQQIVVKAYNFIPKDSQYPKIGISITSEGKKVERAINFKDVPKLEFAEKRGKKRPTNSSLEQRDDYFYEIMEKALKNLAWDSNGQPEEKPAPKKEEAVAELKSETKPTKKKAVEVKQEDIDEQQLPF